MKKKVVSIGKNFEGFARIEAIDDLLQSLEEEDRRRALASILRFETYKERLAMEELTEDGITEETREGFLGESQLLAGLFEHIHGDNGEKEWNKFAKKFIA